jgi:hypothetical protein
MVVRPTAPCHLRDADAKRCPRDTYPVTIAVVLGTWSNCNWNFKASNGTPAGGFLMQSKKHPHEHGAGVNPRCLRCQTHKAWNRNKTSHVVRCGKTATREQGVQVQHEAKCTCECDQTGRSVAVTRPIYPATAHSPASSPVSCSGRSGPLPQLGKNKIVQYFPLSFHAAAACQSPPATTTGHRSPLTAAAHRSQLPLPLLLPRYRYR